MGEPYPWPFTGATQTRACLAFPGADLAWAAWHLAKEAATSSWVSGRKAPELWAVRDAAKMDREAIAHASTATWLREQGERRCSPVSTPFFDQQGGFWLVFHDDLGPLWRSSEACP